MSRLTRRGFLSAATTGSLAYLARRGLAAPGRVAASMQATRIAANKRPAAKPEQSPIKHVIVVMMENRSFDHILGWLPGADGMQAGLVYQDNDGTSHPTFPLAPDYQGCSYADPETSYSGSRVVYDGGACDGWLLVNPDDYSIGYYTQSDLAFLGHAAVDWTVCDRYFASIMAPTYPNRMYQHCGVTDRLDDSLALSSLPTIWDRLAARGLDGRYYFSDVPFLGLWGDKYLGIMRTFDDFVADCASGDLPQVAYVDPRFAGETEGISDDDHPHSDIRAGETFLSRVYAAVTTSPQWRHTVLVINFDEWGGFFDHVTPTAAPDVDPAYQLRGFRVPCLVISPFARRGYVDSTVFDHTSILRMIEQRWGLEPLSVRDANANDLAAVLDFSRSSDLAVPSYSVPDVESLACGL